MQAITSQEFFKPQLPQHRLRRRWQPLLVASGRGGGLVTTRLLALGLYASEKFWLKNFHARLPHHLGFRAEYLDLTQSAKLADARTLLMASAAAVPITPPSTASQAAPHWTTAFTTASPCRKTAKVTLKPWCC